MASNKRIDICRACKVSPRSDDRSYPALCVECASVKKKASLAKWRAAHPERNREINDKSRAKFFATEEGVLRRKAREAVQKALRKGLMFRQRCEVCGHKAQAHHEDYRAPLNVNWLCHKHHLARHAEIRGSND